MHRFIIDTDIGADDAVAIMMALQHPDVRVEAITTVAGNVGVEQATAFRHPDIAGDHFQGGFHA